MFSKNTLIIGIVIVLAVIGGFVFFSRDSSAPDEALEKGVKNLTRDSAAEMIETKFKVEPYHMTPAKIEKLGDYDKEKGQFSTKVRNGNSYDKDKVGLVKKLEEAGLTKIISEEKENWGTVSFFDFTAKAEPYLVKGNEEWEGYVFLKEVIDIEVTGLTEPAEMFGAKFINAEYKAKYKQTPFGEVWGQEVPNGEFKNTASFVLYDDGWRIGR